MATDIPLFPLGTVLFPEALLPLRIFETRYTDMVRRCMREQQPFGVLLIRQGAEAGAVQAIAEVGTSARIVDFSTLQDGLLGIECRGERRFRVLRRWQQADGLHVGEVDWLSGWESAPPPPDAGALAELLRRNWDEVAGQFANEQPRFDDAAWLCARLAQLLPLPPALRQQLLESASAALALQTLASLVEPEQQDA